VQALDPAGVGARNLRECMLLQIESVNGRGGVAWQIVSNHMRLSETRQYREIAKLLGRPHPNPDVVVEEGGGHRLAERFATGIAGKTTTSIIPGAGHLAMIERPAETNDALRAFVIEIESLSQSSPK